MRALTAVLLLVTGASCSPAADPDPQVSSGPEATGAFILTFEEAEGEEDAEARRLLESSEAVTAVIDDVNALIALRDDVRVSFGSYDIDAGPAFDPEANEIVYPYGFVTLSASLLDAGGRYEEDTLADAALGATVFVLYHELGHALIANLDIPFTGREEDAVDGLAAVLLTDWEGGGDAVLAAADLFEAFDEQTEELTFEDFAGEHSLDVQRFITFKCLLFGSAPDNYGFLVDEGELPEERAELCEEEFDQTADSWSTLLDPHLEDAA